MQPATVFHEEVEAAKKERGERVLGPGVFPGDLEEMFTYHPPTTDHELEAYGILREQGKEMAKAILTWCPNSGDRTVAIRKVREAIMIANSSIANRGRF